MTYLSTDCDYLCRRWCPLVDQCEEGHICHDMDVIRRKIIKISDFDLFKDDFDE